MSESVLHMAIGSLKEWGEGREGCQLLEKVAHGRKHFVTLRSKQTVRIFV